MRERKYFYNHLESDTAEIDAIAPDRDGLIFRIRVVIGYALIRLGVFMMGIHVEVRQK